MKIYLIKDSDFDRLLAGIDRDPHRGDEGRSARVLTDVEQAAHDEAHRFFNYQICIWIKSVQKGDT